jgi:glycerol-3-phosphate dehydrogenase
MSAGRLDPAERTRALHRLGEETVDVLVLGGGVVGAGAALDAASRGLTVGLLERRDWASGTSSRSSRLAHGGLRYLEQLEFGLVHQALTERGLLLDRLAPHLVRSVPFLLPLTHRGWERPYVGTGVALYDVLSRVSRKGGALPGHRHLSRKATARLAPALVPTSYTGAIGFFDAQIDDARHTLAVVRTAAAHGALVASRVEVTGFLRDGDSVVGVEALDHESGRTLRIRARVVAGATGVWTEETRHLLGSGDAAPSSPGTVVASKGVHLVVPRSAIKLYTALIARTGNSVLFLLPWGQTWLIGTTDTPWEGDRDEPSVTSADVDYLLTEANRWLLRPLTGEDVISVYGGLRPLLADPDGSTQTAKLSREHAVTRPAPGLVQIAGGKYTTYRVMARDLVDTAAVDLPFGVPASRTDEVPLVGAEGFASAWQTREADALTSGMGEPQLRRLLRRYGADAAEVLATGFEEPALLEPVHPAAPVLRMEVRYAVSHEGAMRLEDVLLRRTRLAFVTRDGARSVADDVARLIAPLLGWDDDRVASEVADFEVVAPRVP